MRRADYFSLVLAIIFVSVPLNVSAQPEKMIFSHREFSTGEVFLSGDGPITSESSRDFQIYISQFESGTLRSISLNSDGGNLGAAMELGRLIRRQRITTVVSGDARCLSACAFAYLGGTERLFVTDFNDDERANYSHQTRLGFHSFVYAPIEALSNSEIQILGPSLSRDIQGITSILSNYVAEMGVSTELVSISSEIPADNFRFFDYDDLVRLNIITWRPEVDTGQFELVPDGNRLLAIFRHENQQFAVTCSRWKGGQTVPIMLASQAIAPSVELLPAKLDEIVTLSHVESNATLPWTELDIDHRHFHADKWLGFKILRPVFAIYSLGDFDVPVTASNVDFRTEPDFFHAIVVLTPDMVRSALTEPQFRFGFSEGSSLAFVEGADPFWEHRFINTDAERDMIRFALRDCI